MKSKYSLKKDYLSCKKDFLDNKNYFIFSLALFCFFIIVGFGLPIFFRNEIIEMLMNLVNMFEGRSMFDTILLIFFNNAKAALFAIMFGIFLGIFPLAILIVNGYLVGFTGRLASEEFGLGVMTKLIPHGIFELPAIVISAGFGMKLGLTLLSNRKKFKEEFGKATKFYFLVIIPLLIIAAIIEGVLVFLSN